MQLQFAKPAEYRTLLTVDNAKTVKGEPLGYLTGILYLAPANSAGRGDICGSRTDGCTEACLNLSGRSLVWPTILEARHLKTHFYFDNPRAFMDSLRFDIASLCRRAKREGLKPAVRVNGTSDLPKIPMKLAAEYPRVMFYDYTKHAKPWLRARRNYRITFSHSGENMPACIDALEHGINVSVVFSTKRGEKLPRRWNGYRVIDGDKHDLRFLDPRGVIVGLRAKGPAKQDTSGFVILA